MANIVVVSGRMVADPELRNISEDKAVCNFRIAVPKRFKPQEGADSDFFNAVAWNHTAEFICKYFSKGKRIELVGSLQTRNWEDREGNRRTATEIAVSSVDFVGDKEKSESKGVAAQSSSRQAVRPGYTSPPAPVADAEYIDYEDGEDLSF